MASHNGSLGIGTQQNDVSYLLTIPQGVLMVLGLLLVVFHGR
jgi:hypothetical protein